MSVLPIDGLSFTGDFQPGPVTRWSDWPLPFQLFSWSLPLTIRSGLTPLFGTALSGPLGHVVDIVSVIATILGVSVTIGYGVSQFASGIFNITGASWMMGLDGNPTKLAMLLALVIVMGASTLSALSGVGRGIKWLSNINMGLSLFLLGFFILFGATLFVFKALLVGIWDYLVALVPMSVIVWTNDGTVTGTLAGWQGGWTIFYWAWWIAFALSACSLRGSLAGAAFGNSSLVR